jgi:hypothetical protein
MQIYFSLLSSLILGTISWLLAFKVQQLMEKLLGSNFPSKILKVCHFILFPQKVKFSLFTRSSFIIRPPYLRLTQYQLCAKFASALAIRYPFRIEHSS